MSNITSAQTHKYDLGTDLNEFHFVSEASLAHHEIEEVAATWCSNAKSTENILGGRDRRRIRSGSPQAPAIQVMFKQVLLTQTSEAAFFKHKIIRNFRTLRVLDILKDYVLWVAVLFVLK